MGYAQAEISPNGAEIQGQVRQSKCYSLIISKYFANFTKILFFVFVCVTGRM